MTGLAELIAHAVDTLPHTHQKAIRDMLDELLWQQANPEHIRIKTDRYDQLTQEAALTITQAVKVKAMKK